MRGLAPRDSEAIARALQVERRSMLWKLEAQREVDACLAQRKDLSDRDILAQAALKWLQMIRSDFPGLARLQPLTDEELFALAGRVADLVWGT